MADKVTTMVLKVDLECPCCYKKVKKILCKFPQIRNQVYDEKANTVTITVVCCNPEKIRDRLCCKGYKVIKSIEIKEPPKPKAPEKPKEPEKPKDKPKEPEKSNVIVIEKPKEPEKPKEKPKEPEKHKVIVIEKPKEAVEKPKPKEPEKPIDVPKPGPPKTPEPVSFQGCPPMYPVPTGRTCCEQCYNGYGGGPCYQGFGVPPPPQPYHDGYYGYGYGHESRGCHVNRCDYYFSEENSQSCSIM